MALSKEPNTIDKFLIGKENFLGKDRNEKTKKNPHLNSLEACAHTTLSAAQILNFFLFAAAGGIQTCGLSVTCVFLLNHCTTLSLVSILHFVPHKFYQITCKL